jgi:putative pantetheine hydrolase
VPGTAPSNVDPFGRGSLTDVAGVGVGHHQRTGRGWQTGTTVVLVPGGAVVSVDVRGGGPGTRETDALDARNLVDRVHAVCLSGGSAYGLAAADGVMAHLEHRGLGVRVGPDPAHVVPVVPTAVVFDLGRGGAFGNRPTAEFGARAASAARTAAAKRGSVGAGTGARAGGLQGGVGMASARVLLESTTITVAGLAVVNASGSVIDPASGLPWCPPSQLRRPSAQERAAWSRAVAVTPDLDQVPPMNTTIGVVATDAALSRPEAGRLAQSAHDGLARAVRPAHLLTDGDTVFGMATGALPLPPSNADLLREASSRTGILNRLFAAAADVFAAAVTDAVLNARTIGPSPAYRDLCPTAFRAVTA